MQRKVQELIAQKKVFLLDLDGTLYLDETPIGDMAHTLEALREHGKRVVYLTNNSSKTAEEYVRKLSRIGFYREGDLVYTSAMATAEYLRAAYPQKKVYLAATDAVKAEFFENGIEHSEEEGEIAVLAYDTTIDFRKFCKLNELIVRGAPYVATHPDAVCPAKGVFPPDVGSFIALLEASSGRRPDVICGKPDRIMGDCIRRRLGVRAEEVVMVGDRLHTDIRFGNRNGFSALLVYSGETRPQDLEKSADRPDLILDSLNDIVAYL